MTDWDDLHPGGSNEGDEYTYGIAPSHAARIADEIIADTKRYGTAREDKSVHKPGARRNRHLDGYGDPRR